MGHNVFELQLAELGRSHEHLDSQPALQIKFQSDVRALFNVFDSKGNPFLIECKNLVVLDSREVVEPEVTASYTNLKQTGLELVSKYTKERLVDCVVPVSDIIPRNSVPLFSNRPQPSKDKKTSQLQAMKMNALLANQMFLSLRARPDVDMLQFFSHECSRVPPSLSDTKKVGKLRPSNKCELLSPSCINAPKEAINNLTVMCFKTNE